MYKYIVKTAIENMSMETISDLLNSHHIVDSPLEVSVLLHVP